MPTDNKYRPLIICVDIAAFGALVYAVCSMILAFLQPGPAEGALSWPMKIYIQNLPPVGLSLAWLIFYRYSNEWYKTHPFLLTMINNSRFQFCADIAAIIVAGYWPYCFVWAFMHPEIHSNPLPLRLQLLLASIVPSLFAMFWLIHRYVSDWTVAHPLFLKLVTNRRLKSGLLIVALVLASIAAHLKGR